VSATFTSSRSPRTGCSPNSPVDFGSELEDGFVVAGVRRRHGELVRLGVGQVAGRGLDLGDGDLAQRDALEGGLAVFDGRLLAGVSFPFCS
jgi:hypothetical protein